MGFTTVHKGTLSEANMSSGGLHSETLQLITAVMLDFGELSVLSPCQTRAFGTMKRLVSDILKKHSSQYRGG